MEITQLWKDYQDGRSYQNSLSLQKTIEENVRFYQGEQWAPVTEATAHLPRPVINMVKMIARSKKAAILSTPVRLVYTAENDSMAGQEFTDFAYFIQKEMRQDELDNKAIKDGLLKGSYFYHYYWDKNAKGTLAKSKGALRCDLIEPLNIFFSNPNLQDEQKQQWIIIASREEVSKVKEKADEGVDLSLITADEYEGGDYSEQENADLCTVLTRYFKKDGEIWCERGTKRVIFNEAFSMTPDLRVARKNLGLSEGEEGKVKATLFPIVAGSYEEREHSIYGISEVEGLIPNQKAMNLTMAMQILSTQRLAWGKYIVKKDALKNQDITDEPGQVLVDYSAEGEGIKRLHEPGFSSMPLQIVNTLADLSRTMAGATDVIMGDYYADLSGTAIARLQSQANLPIEELRGRFWRAKEKQGRVLEQFFKLYYKDVVFKGEKSNEVSIFDGSKYAETEFSLLIEPISGTRASAAGDINMLDNLLNRGDISLLTYLENYPDDALCNKKQLIEDVKNKHGLEVLELGKRLEEAEKALKEALDREQASKKALDSVESLVKENMRLKETLSEVYRDAEDFAKIIVAK